MRRKKEGERLGSNVRMEKEEEDGGRRKEERREEAIGWLFSCTFLTLASPRTLPSIPGTPSWRGKTNAALTVGKSDPHHNFPTDERWGRSFTSCSRSKFSLTRDLESHSAASVFKRK